MKRTGRRSTNIEDIRHEGPAVRQPQDVIDGAAESRYPTVYVVLVEEAHDCRVIDTIYTTRAAAERGHADLTRAWIEEHPLVGADPQEVLP